jgi:hypothetical protein
MARRAPVRAPADRDRRRGHRRLADFGHLEPIVDAAERELKQIGVTEVAEVVVADAGYWH